VVKIGRVNSDIICLKGLFKKEKNKKEINASKTYSPRAGTGQAK